MYDRGMRDRKAPTRPGAGEDVDASGAQPGRSTLAGRDNVDLTKLNYHQGFDPNRLGRPGGGSFHTIKKTSFFNDDGSIAKVPACPEGHLVDINAGAITTMICHGPDMPKTPIRCVYVFQFRHPGEKPGKGTSVSAWMPATAVNGIVATEQQALAERIARSRHDGQQKFGHPIRIVNASASKDGVEGLYTYRNQPKGELQNHADYYYGNLALNLPASGGPSRVGVSADSIPEAPPGLHGLDPYREFYPAEPYDEQTIPLYKFKSPHPDKGKVLRFVYGYVKNDDDKKIHGWINRSCLGAAVEPTDKPGK